jgi:hypothetical protein
VGLIDDLGSGPVGLDTAIFIYFVEEPAEFLGLVEPLFVGLDGALVGRDLELDTSRSAGGAVSRRRHRLG